MHSFREMLLRQKKITQKEKNKSSIKLVKRFIRTKECTVWLGKVFPVKYFSGAKWANM